MPSGNSHAGETFIKRVEKLWWYDVVTNSKRADALLRLPLTSSTRQLLPANRIPMRHHSRISTLSAALSQMKQYRISYMLCDWWWLSHLGTIQAPLRLHCSMLPKKWFRYMFDLFIYLSIYFCSSYLNWQIVYILIKMTINEANVHS